MDNIENDIINYSKEVKDILSTPPKIIYRVGYYLLVIFFVIALCLSYCIKYPETVSVKSKITLVSPYQNIYPNITGEIDSLFVNDRDFVCNRQPLLLFENKASYNDVKYLETVLKKFKINQKDIEYFINETKRLKLGELTKAYNNFVKKVHNSQTKKNKEITDISNEIDLLQKKISLWGNQFIIKSNLGGQVLFTSNWSKYDKVKINDLLFSIVPIEKDYVCILEVSSKDINKIKKGQRVNINPIGYNVNQFGYLKGNIEKIYSIPYNTSQMHKVKVSLSNELITTNGQTVELETELFAQSEIVLKDKRLIERIFPQLN